MIITDRYKEQGMSKDLDQSDVNRDAETMMQKVFEEWGEHVDPADLYGVIMTLESHDLLNGYDNLLDAPIVQELIADTQSNPKKAEYALRQMIDLDNAMAEL